MASGDRQGDLFPGTPLSGQALIVNDRCLVRTQDGHRVIMVAGIVHSQYTLGDHMAEAYAMVSLVEQGWADQKEVARAFDCTTRTVRRQQRRFESGGLAALGHGCGFPRGQHRLRGSRSQLIQRLKTQGHPNREIARRIGVSEKAIRKLLRRQGWRTRSPEQPFLLDARPPGADPNLSAFREAAEEGLPFSLDSDPANRSLDRIMACLGLLEDAAPLFRSGTRVPGAGVLLALPALVQSGVFDCAREIYGSLGLAFYGLRTTILALLLMALLRIKRPEALKEHVPEDLGRVLGLDRAPEVKTLRRKLARLAATGRATQFGHALAERRVALRGSAMGFLYVDGHVRVYHGRHEIPKAHVARMRLALPATSDYWVNDMSGDPLFVVTAPANAGLVKMLPTVLGEVRTLVGERRVTVVFDRGGYSPKLFQKLIAEGFDILTYRKGRTRPVPRARFQECKAIVDGREVVYTLADQGVLLLKGKLRLRQVTRLSSNNHQTPILTSRRDLPAVEVAFRMFERWRQENFFKYLREEYALDALVDYRVVPDTPTREVPNPARALIEDKLREARALLTQLQAEYGREALENTERTRPTMRGFKIAKSKHGRAIAATHKRIARLEKARSTLPRRLPVEDVVSGDVVRLAPERKHLTNLIKMVAYQAEGDLVRMVATHYRRVEEEGRTLIQCALTADADLEIEGRTLRVVIAPLSSRHRTQAIAALCEELNRATTTFPGTRLRLQYAVRVDS
jgi:transposase